MEITQTETGPQSGNVSPANSDGFTNINLKSDQKSSLSNCFIAFINKHNFSFVPKFFSLGLPSLPRQVLLYSSLESSKPEYFPWKTPT